MGRAALLVSVLFAGCAQSESIVCDDGTTCPGGFQCDIEHHRCLLPAQVAACEGKADGDDCTYNNMPGACQFGACETFYCGDGRITIPEQCEPGFEGAPDDLGMNANGEQNSCLDLGYYEPAGLACDPHTCRYDTAACGGGRCGDVELNGPELCDGPTNETCVSIGFDAGSVSCNALCGFNVLDCSRFGWNPESLADVQALAVAGSGPNDQWAVGDSGKAMHYEGAFWNTYPTGVINPLVGAWSGGPDDTWAVGLGVNSANPAVILHWTGKQTGWSKITNAPAGEYVDVWGVGSNVYVATEASGILHYNGSAWETLGNLGDGAMRIHGVSPTNVYVATSTGPLAQWNGSTWTTLTATPLAGVKFEFLDANADDDVWAAGHMSAAPGTGVIAHYNGSAWTVWKKTSEQYNNIASSAPNDAWVAGVDGIMRHWDGQAWSRSTNIGASPSGLTAISGFISLSGTEVLAVSTLRLAYRYRGQAYGIYNALGPNPFDATQNNAMFGTRADNQHVVNVKGEVWHFDGDAWANVHTIDSVNVVPAKAIHGSGADNIWVGADNGTMHHWDGASWSSETATTSTIYNVWVAGAGEVWAFTSSLAFHKEGTMWKSYLLGGAPVLSVSGTSPSDIWVVEGGTSHKLWHWNGTAWTDTPVTTADTDLLAVVAVSDTDVHVTGKNGRMNHYNGSTWTQQTVTPLAELEFLTATGPHDVIAASQRDLFHFNGIEWSNMRPPVDFVPNTADYIPIVGIQASPGRIDMLLDRYRIRTLLRTRALRCELHEVCGDSVDNNCNGDIDSSDAECP
jgi:hypothetical protein